MTTERLQSLRKQLEDAYTYHRTYRNDMTKEQLKLSRETISIILFQIDRELEKGGKKKWL